jgi:hypothetical protein
MYIECTNEHGKQQVFSIRYENNYLYIEHRNNARDFERYLESILLDTDLRKLRIVPLIEMPTNDNDWN